MSTEAETLLTLINRLRQAGQPFVTAEECFSTPEDCFQAIRAHQRAKEELTHAAHQSFNVPLGIALRCHTFDVGAKLRQPGWPDLPISISHRWSSLSYVGDDANPEGAQL